MAYGRAYPSRQVNNRRNAKGATSAPSVCLPLFPELRKQRPRLPGLRLLQLSPRVEPWDSYPLFFSSQVGPSRASRDG